MDKISIEHIYTCMTTRDQTDEIKKKFLENVLRDRVTHMTTKY
jgi:hypothetical protein